MHSEGKKKTKFLVPYVCWVHCLQIFRKSICTSHYSKAWTLCNRNPVFLSVTYWNIWPETRPRNYSCWPSSGPDARSPSGTLPLLMTQLTWPACSGQEIWQHFKGNYRVTNRLSMRESSKEFGNSIWSQTTAMTVHYLSTLFKLMA